MRCRCGVPLKGSIKRCRACALDYLKQWDTDRFELQAQNTPIVLDFSDEEIKRWQEMSEKSIPRVPRKVTPWSETDYRRRSNFKMWCGIGLALVIFTLVLWALVNG
jgi:hypothetical protein